MFLIALVASSVGLFLFFLLVVNWLSSPQHQTPCRVHGVKRTPWVPQWPCRDRKCLISTSSGPYNHSPPVAPSFPLPTLGKKAGDFLSVSSGRGKRPVAFWRPREPRDVPSPFCLRILPACPFLPFSFLSFSSPPPLQVWPQTWGHCLSTTALHLPSS